MRPELYAAAVQFNIALGEIDRNLAKVDAALDLVAKQGSQLVVLPEMWSSGYDYKRLAKHAAATPRVIEALCRRTSELGLVVIGSLPEQDGDKIYNTAYVIDQGKLVGSYRKLHMFSTMEEERYISPGNSTLVTDTTVGRIGVAICYDLRFPELFRRMALDGAELICLPAEWPKPRQEHWRALLRARAIENQLFIAAANCCGIQGKLDFFGMSLLISARGEVLAEADETDTVLHATFAREEMMTYREQISCFADRRPEIYGSLT